jgi:DNA polymerase I-like protein with 3'-5' exonuclease and polymerase domains
LSKDLTTYYISLDEKTGEYKGMLTLVGIDSIIHHSINHTSTVTARFSSSNPNLQNVPKGAIDEVTGELLSGSQVKTVFISRFGTDGQIVQSDFTALEVYVQAILTGCKQLIEDLKQGLDMHCVRVSQKEKISYEEAVLKCKGDKSKGIAPLPEWIKKRSGAKEFSFQRAYGAGATKISETTGMSIEDVKDLIAAEESRYPELAAYNKAKEERIKKSRRPTQNIQPHPEVKGLMCQLGKGYSVTPDNKVYSYRESPAPGWLIRQGGMPQSFSPTEIANYEVQGAGGEWAKAAMWLAIRAFYARKNFGGKALLVNQVHDALYMDASKDVLTEASALLHACMLAASDFMESWFGWPVTVPVPSVTVHGNNMMEENGFTGDFDEQAQTAREDLRRLYMNGYTPSFLTH